MILHATSFSSHFHFIQLGTLIYLFHVQRALHKKGFHFPRFHYFYCLLEISKINLSNFDLQPDSKYGLLLIDREVVFTLLFLWNTHKFQKFLDNIFILTEFCPYYIFEWSQQKNSINLLKLVKVTTGVDQKFTQYQQRRIVNHVNLFQYKNNNAMRFQNWKFNKIRQIIES